MSVFSIPGAEVLQQTLRYGTAYLKPLEMLCVVISRSLVS
jgi:hypothetical protein